MSADTISRYIDWHSVNKLAIYQSRLSQYMANILANSRSSVGWVSAECQPRYSTDTQPKPLTVGHISAVYWPSIGRHSTDIRRCIDRVTVNILVDSVSRHYPTANIIWNLYGLIFDCNLWKLSAGTELPTPLGSKRLPNCHAWCTSKANLKITQ